MRRALFTAICAPLLVGLGLGAASCSSAPGSQRPIAMVPVESREAGDSVRGADPAAALSPPESKNIARTLTKVSVLRGIAPTKPVPGVKLDRGSLVGRVKEKALRELPPETLRREGLLLQLIGFAPASFDFLGEMLKLLSAKLDGFYDPKNGTMYLAADLEATEAEATLAHELVHALQDQKWDLSKRSDYKPGRSDETMALACLAEGDATSAMLDFLMGHGKSALDIPPDALRELMKSGMNMGDVQSVPHILRSSLMAPYVEGLSFVNEVRRKGGWPMVNRVWDQAPTTTEQILHVDKWESQEGPIAVPAPTATALGVGWKKEDDDSFGELGLALTFAEWMPDEDARKAASGWGGDRTATYTKGDELAYAAHLRFDAASAPARADAFAERMLTLLAPALKKKVGAPAIASKTSLCVERKDLGPLLFARKNRDVVMINGPATTRAGTWTSGATCTTAQTWADEVLKQ